MYLTIKNINQQKKEEYSDVSKQSHNLALGRYIEVSASDFDSRLFFLHKKFPRRSRW
mgnify:CR=1 FL=1